MRTTRNIPKEIEMRGPAKHLGRCKPRPVSLQAVRNRSRRSLLITLPDGKKIEIDVSSEQAKEQLRWVLRDTPERGR